jgi:hypothetical protein
MESRRQAPTPRRSARSDDYRRDDRRDRELRRLLRDRLRDDRLLLRERRPPATSSRAVPLSSTMPAGLAGTSDWVARNIGSLQAFTMLLMVMVLLQNFPA